MKTFAILLGTIVSALPLSAQPLAVGAAQFTLPAPEPIKVFTYKPAGFDHGPLLVVFHGVERNAEQYRNHAIGMAEKFKAMVVAPQFDAARFKSERYQRGGVIQHGKLQPQDRWTYAMVLRLVAHLRAKERCPHMPYYLIGHSAGGQFLDRLAAFMPGDACRIVVSNPSSYLFPTRALPYGYGFANLPPGLRSDEVMRTYLASPLTLYLGTGDTSATAKFDDSPTAMRQGASRIARGRACFAMAQKLAAKKNWTFNWRKIETRGVGHSAAQMFAANEVGDALFGSAEQNRPARARLPAHVRAQRGSPHPPMTKA